MWESLRTVRVYLWRYRRSLALGLGALVLKDIAGAAQPLVIRAAIDTLARAFGLGRLLRFAGLLIGLAAIKGIFQYWMRVIIIGISRDIEYDLRNDLFRHLVELSPDYYGHTRTGDIMARATNDLNAVRMMLGPGIMYWTETSLTFLLAIAIMLSVDWRLALFAVLPAPLVSLAVIFFGRAIHTRFERSREPGRRAHGAGLCTGAGRVAPLREVEPRVHQGEHPAGTHLGRLPAAA